MPELSFVVDQTALETVKNTVISANFDEMKAALTEFVKPYESVIVTEDAISTAKSDRAKLRSIANHIDSYRKSVKNIYSEPLKQFEAKCKELTGIIDNGVANLDGQVKEYEQKRKEEKIFLLRDYFDNSVKNMKHPAYAEWDRVFNPKWENVTYKVEDAHKDIDIFCLNVDRDVDQIISLSSEFQLPLLEEYRKSHDIFATFQLQERLAAQKLREDERQRELENQYREERAKKVAEGITNQSNPIPEAEKEPAPRFIGTYKICGTYEELMSFENLLKTLKVSFAKIQIAQVAEDDV